MHVDKQLTADGRPAARSRTGQLMAAAAVANIERALVAMRRSQRRRVLARLAQERTPTATRPQAPHPTDPVFDVLDALEAAEQSGAGVSVSSLARALDVDEPRASRLVTAAVEAGLIRRNVDQADGRRTQLVRTAAGRRASEQAHQFRRDMFAAVMRDWAPREQAVFARLLSRFVNGLDQLSSEARHA